jgi:hypothetical protein
MRLGVVDSIYGPISDILLLLFGPVRASSVQEFVKLISR